MSPRPPPPTPFIFPDPRTGRGPNGSLCHGGDFAPGTLLAAYRKGIFPWPISASYVPWCSPDPRALFLLDRAPVWSRTVRRALAKPFRITFDHAFPEVVAGCADREEGTWLIGGLAKGFTELHALGWAHSIEVWNDATGELVGGLYGIALGAMFTGESMFHRETDASKVAFAALMSRLYEQGFHFFDAQLMTSHLASLGCVPVARDQFLARLERARGDERPFPTASR